MVHPGLYGFSIGLYLVMILAALGQAIVKFLKFYLRFTHKYTWSFAWNSPFRFKLAFYAMVFLFGFCRIVKVNMVHVLPQF